MAKILDNKNRREQYLEEKQKEGVRLTNQLNNGEIVDKNSDIFALVHGRYCNPNGDPNMEDDVRYDYATGRIQITRACFHNMIRMGLEFFYLKLFNSRVYKEKFFDKYNRVPTSNNRVSIQVDDIILDFSNGLEDFYTCIDRGFGAVVTEKGGDNNLKHFAGVSFDTMLSLNKVERLAEESVNTAFASDEKNKKQESFGTTNRIHYFLMPIKGGVSKGICQKLFVTQEIIKMYDYAFINSFYNMKSYKKSGMKCPLYMRVEYKDNRKRDFIGNLNDYITGTPKANKVLDMQDFEVDLSRLVEVLSENKDIIHRIYFHEDSVTRNFLTKGTTCKELLTEAGLEDLLVPVERPF